MQREDVNEIAAIPLPTSPQVEEIHESNSLGQLAAQPEDAQDKVEEGSRNGRSAAHEGAIETDIHDNLQTATVIEVKSSPVDSEVQSPPPPTPPSKGEVLPRTSLGTTAESTFQDVPLEPPAPPSEKHSANLPQSENGHVVQHPETPRTPSTRGQASRMSRNLSTDSSSTGPGHQRSLTMSHGNTVSVVLISSALEMIASSKEAKRSFQLKEAVDKALTMVRSGQGGDRPREIFEPLRLACESGSEKLMIASLDCISKLISYSFFADDEPPAEHGLTPPGSPNPSAQRASFTASQTNIRPPNLVDMVTHTITSCHTETSSDAVSLQIVKALLSLVLSPTILVHQSSLLKAVRTVYNIFLLSPDPVNQTVAQGGLTQMVHHVFTRCKANLPKGEGSVISSETAVSGAPSPKQNGSRNDFTQTESTATSPDSQTPSMSLANGHTENGRINGEGDSNPQSIHLPESHESGENTPQRESHQREVTQDSQASENQYLETEHPLPGRQISTNDLFTKDAFLVFRALCKLTMKNLNTESERDLKSHAMRSKLLSLHLVLTILNSHMQVFVDPASIIYSSTSNEATTFIQATKQYLCLTISRNALSPVPQVFEISVEIFWRVLSGMRTKLKKEIEVFFHEIFIPILEMKNSTLKQKSVILGMLGRLCQDPQALVEIYLNYDCDREAVDNIYEHLMNSLSKISSATHPQTAAQKKEDSVNSPRVAAKDSKAQKETVPPTLTTAALAVPGNADNANLGHSEAQLKRQGLESLVAVLRSLLTWGTAAGKSANDSISESASLNQSTGSVKVDGMTSDYSLDKLSAPYGSNLARVSTPELSDDPGRFESEKQRKNTLQEGVRRFNYKPKKGIEFLVDAGFIPSKAPIDIARFLLTTDGLNKAIIGEYLGEGEEANIATMHAFVDLLDFANLPFVNALRLFLQSFRLPGEAQKIDRFMLKFAERYIAGNIQTPFANADAAYVLAYSIILLNTDAHNPQIKNRMTKADFIKNNRGINDNADLPEELLSSIFDEITSNEIRMKDEVEANVSVPTPGPGIAAALANVGRDLQKEAFVIQSLGMANKTEALFRTLMRSQRRGSRGVDQFFSASHFVHVKPMFEVAWIPFLAGISGPLTDTDNLEIVELCLEGFKCAIKIVCFFDLELARNAFVTTLAKFTFLNNLGEMKTKNMEAIKTLLDIAVTEGNSLRGSWQEVLTCVSQLERMQLISSGIDLQESGRRGRTRKLPAEELANESRSTHITVAADMVFSLSHYLSGTAIVEFVRALCHVSWEEIQSSGLSEHPRLFSLQKLVEISYYNMNRIRIEWSNLWDILGEHFNKVCCHHNPHVGFFALDALRQLAMRFMEKAELPHFKFQKDFLKPFEYAMIHNSNPEIRDLVLQCLQQMIQVRAHNLRSGWRALFGVFAAASKVQTERIVNSSFELVTRINKDHFSDIVKHGAFADLTVCITDFCKVSKFQKISLLAIAMLRGVIPTMLACPECPLCPSYAPEAGQAMSIDEAMIKFWFPVLFSFYDIIMNGEDLEVRRLALDSLFNTLKKYGSDYTIEFWDTVCQELLFPMFAVLKSPQDISRWSTQEDMSVWLSTTLIQALRDLIDLYTYYFETLERFLDGLLELLCVCICQENDTLARIGTSCLQQLLEKNVKKLSAQRWERVVTAFVRLFKTTTPHQLFDENLRVDVDGNSPDAADSQDGNGQTIVPAPLSPNGESNTQDSRVSASARRRIFKQIIVKCVLQLLLIETTNELLGNEDVYNTIPPAHLLRLMGVLDHSYQFARVFNEDRELRTALWKVGFMKHLPNLLKQETSSASTLVTILVQMYYDPRQEHQAVRVQVADKLMPLSVGVIQDFNKLRPESQSKNIAAWIPVIGKILKAFCRMDEKAFGRYLPVIYPLTTELLAKELIPEVRESLRDYFVRVGQSQGILDRT